MLCCSRSTLREFYLVTAFNYDLERNPPVSMNNQVILCSFLVPASMQSSPLRSEFALRPRDSLQYCLAYFFTAHGTKGGFGQAILICKFHDDED